MYQLFSLRDCGIDHIYLMRKKSQAPEKFSDYVCQVGAPNYMINDSAEELTGSAWLKVACNCIINTIATEPHHQNSNLNKQRGGALKDALQLLFPNTPWASLCYW